MIGFYVSVLDPSDHCGNGRVGLAYGPLDDHAHALECVPAVRRVIEAADVRAAFYGFGTCRVEVPSAERLPVGRANEYISKGV